MDILAIGILIFLAFGLLMIIARLYRRASKEISYVRTGFGGQKVIMNGGSLVLPVLHEIIPVNMNTLRLEVRRNNEQALITRDRMRVDVQAEFYVRVKPTAEAIADAAQTLGHRTMQPGELKNLIEGKFVDALRSVAAEMAMEELHEQRSDFVLKVQQVVSEDLLKNGLELESVSLTGLDQTGMEFFNPNNAFDAEGLTRLTDEIERRRKIRNDIEQDTQVQIREKNLDAERQKLQIGREEEYARLAQEREIEVRRASQKAEIAQEQAEKEQAAEQAKIMAAQQVQQSQITSELAVEQERIDKQRAVETQDVDRLKAVELAEQDRAIAIAEKSKAQSEAQEQADYARAKAVQAEEAVKTSRDTEAANREKEIELIEAAKNAEREAIKVKVGAEAEKAAAADQAEAIRLEASGEAEAEKLKAAAAEIRYAVEAEGKRAINEAANVLSHEQIAMQVKLELLQKIEGVLRESVKPMEHIDSIKIVQVEGLNGAGGNGGHYVNGAADGAGIPLANGNGNANLADQVVNSALRYRAQAPLVDSLLKEVGLSSDDLNGLIDPLHEDGDEKHH